MLRTNHRYNDVLIFRNTEYVAYHIINYMLAFMIKNKHVKLHINFTFLINLYLHWSSPMIYSNL